jgi:large subunit ribosomal protein L19
MQANVLQKSQLKAKIAQIQPGDTVRVHQIIREGSKTRTQVFEGLVIRYRKPNDGNAYLTVRKIASGVGVEKSWFVHSPNVEKIEVVRRAKVRRAFLSYMRGLRGKKARLMEQEFDKTAANDVDHRTAAELAEAEAEAKTAETQANATDEGVVESTEELAKEENKEAAAEDAQTDGDNEQDLAAAETQEGLDKAEAEDDKQQAKEA